MIFLPNPREELEHERTMSALASETLMKTIKERDSALEELAQFKEDVKPLLGLVENLKVTLAAIGSLKHAELVSQALSTFTQRHKL